MLLSFWALKELHFEVLPNKYTPIPVSVTLWQCSSTGGAEGRGSLALSLTWILRGEKPLINDIVGSPEVATLQTKFGHRPPLGSEWQFDQKRCNLTIEKCDYKEEGESNINALGVDTDLFSLEQGCPVQGGRNPSTDLNLRYGAVLTQRGVGPRASSLGPDRSSRPSFHAVLLSPSDRMFRSFRDFTQSRNLATSPAGMGQIRETADAACVLLHSFGLQFTWKTLLSSLVTPLIPIHMFIRVGTFPYPVTSPDLLSKQG
ncbi:hypothetical protein JZ751_027337 [Albula glossodonta]|uniref:Uncharacterized protein n=1 Tax=Albula glossodonta TaxID=121402 RepID=A0A8T2NFC7_9TELE|nr:hypothetical protein JZ751_027337 [Albula glossodonta]